MSAARSLPVVGFKNDHLSVSRLKKYEECARAFFYHYVSKGPREPSGDAAAFGTTLHLALELLYRWVVEEEFRGRIPEHKLIECYRKAWEHTQLATLALYNEGLAILRAYLRLNPEVDAFDIIDVEREFNFEIDGFLVNGRIDRVDRITDGHIAIIDYKSNRQLFTEDELASDLQMSVYGLVARELYPWARKVSFVFHMLRHGVAQGANRTAEIIDDAKGYVVVLGHRTESRPALAANATPEQVQEAWPAKLNPNCQYCESRRRCDVYEKAIHEKRDVARISSIEGTDALLTERAFVSSIAKAAYARQKEIDEVLVAKLERGEEIVGSSFRVRTIQPMSRMFSVEKVARVLAPYGVDRSKIDALVKLPVKDVEKLRDEVAEKLERPQRTLLATTLDASAEMVPGSPKIDVRVVKSNKTEPVAAGEQSR